MPEEKLTRAEWERVCKIEILKAHIAGTDIEIRELEDRTLMEVQALDERKTKLQEEIEMLGG